MWGRKKQLKDEPTNVVYQLIYTGALSGTTNEQDLLEIAQKSAAKNSEKGITGILLTQEGSALQVLEGNEEDVEALFKVIENDPRIRNVIPLIRRHSESREFPKWSMGFRNGDLAQTPKIFDLNKNTLPEIMPENPSNEVQTITQTFARVNGL